MRFLQWFCPLALFAFAPAQEPASPQEEASRWSLGDEARGERTAERMIGAWQIVGVTLRGQPLAAADFAGYAIISSGYMSLEMHAQGLASHFEDGQYFQTGSHRWRMEGDRLVTSTLIGTHNFTEDEVPEFEAPGERREFDVLADGPNLYLNRVDGASRLELRRLPDLPFPGEEIDFFGRAPNEDERR